jgi:photosystem II stability/assembly factor-like uncharacterized protein
VKVSRIRWSSVLLVLPGLFVSHGAAAAAPAQRIAGSEAPDVLKVALVSVVCSSPRKCVAIGAQHYGTTTGSIAVTTTDGGGTWASTPILPDVKYLDALSCATAKTCLAAGSNPVGNDYEAKAIRTVDGGRTWVMTPVLPKGIGIINSISCPTLGYCMGVGVSSANSPAVAVVTNNSGRAWKRLALPKGEESLSLVTCTTPRKCIAEGSMDAVVGEPDEGHRLSIITTSDGGSTWVQSSLSTDPSAPIGAYILSGLTCATQTRCLLVGDATPGDGSASGVIIASDDGGLTWTFEKAPAGTTFLNAISCPSAAQCAVVGGGIEARGGSDQDIVTTSDSGQTWTSHFVPASAVGLDGVSCPSVTSCVGVGFGLSTSDPTAEPAAVVVTADAGATWTAP